MGRGRRPRAGRGSGEEPQLRRRDGAAGRRLRARAGVLLKARTVTPALAALGLALAASTPLRVARADGGRERHPLIPDQAKLQLAGTLGLLSTGAGWALWGRRLELDLLAGWVPEHYAGADLVTFTAKTTWLPLSLRHAGWRLRPLTLGLAVTHTWGDGFWIRHPSRYPSGYYPVPTALRASVAVGGTLGRAVGALREVGVYWELVAGDVPLVEWARNERTVRAEDVISLALGVRVEF